LLGAVGVLAWLQMSADPASPRLGMIWIDAHGDFNTPETTLSDMLSGMPVAITTGLCLHRLRKQARLDPDYPCDVVMVGVRANDPLEQELIDQHGIEMVPAADVKGRLPEAGSDQTVVTASPRRNHKTAVLSKTTALRRRNRTIAIMPMPMANMT